MTKTLEPITRDLSKKSGKGKTIYPSMRMIRRVRHWMSKPVKAVFDVESNPDYMDSDIKEKARLSGLTVKEYKEALEELNNSPTGLLMLTLAQLERDFLQNWGRRMDMALKLAEEAKDYKAVAMIEKEKQLTVERLIKSGRMISPFEAEKPEAKKDDYDDMELALLPNEEGYKPNNT